jgi:phosphatidylglycerol:prolipoprotein diacylglycerol transferase
MIAIAFIVAITIAAKRASACGEDPQNILDLCLYLMISSIAGARLCYVFTNWSYYRSNLIEILFIHKGGLVFYGGVILGTIVAVVFLKLKKLSVWKYLDILTPSLAIGHAIGRIGCFLNGCCFGKVIQNNTLQFLGVRFPRVADTTHVTDNVTDLLIGSPPYLDHLHRGLIAPDATCSLPVYPTQLFATAMNFGIFLILLKLFKKRRFDGQIWWTYIILYAVARFMLEFMRGDNPLLPPFNLTFSQSLAVVLFLAGIIMYNVLRRKQNLKV